MMGRSDASRGPVMVYGATGYCGRPLAAKLCAAGYDVVVAGRHAGRVQQVAGALGTPFRVFDLRDPATIDLALAGVRAVLHAAGPFVDTAAPLMEGCLRAGAHYLDLSGEWSVFARAQAFAAQAEAAGVMLMPGVGAVVVISDCLAAQAVLAAPDTTRLRIATGWGSGPSRGTVRTALRSFASTVIIRRAGVLTTTPLGPAWRSFDYGAGERISIAVTWPDVVTAFRTTRVPNIEGYVEAPLPLRIAARAGAAAMGVVGEAAFQAAATALAGTWPEGPPVKAEGRFSNSVVVEAVDPWGRATRFGRRTLDGYTTTHITAAAIVARVMAGEHPPGFQTPAGVYGPGLIEGLGCSEAYDPGRLALPA